MSGGMGRVPRWAMASPAAASANARACDLDECAAWYDSLGGVDSCVFNFCRCIL